jgi:hypothetical protein
MLFCGAGPPVVIPVLGASRSSGSGDDTRCDACEVVAGCKKVANVRPPEIVENLQDVGVGEVKHGVTTHPEIRIRQRTFDQVQTRKSRLGWFARFVAIISGTTSAPM